MNVFVGLILAVLSWQDIKSKHINVVLCTVSVGIVLCMNIICHLKSIPFMIFGMGTGMLIIGISLLSDNAIGIGDGITFIMTGLVAGGIGNLEILLFSLFAASLVGMYRLIIRKCSRKDTMAFIPYITLGYIMFFLI